MHPLYLHSACAISPQHSFDGEVCLQCPEASDAGKLFVVDAPYQEYINPVAIRRMSRLLKMAITAGMRALEMAGVPLPDAIITGTGRGSMSDTEHFLNDMIRLQEGPLNPTYFIQSTYNSPNGWLALQTQSSGYNQTYVHRGHSLEAALMDAQMLLAETVVSCNILIGSYDEMTGEFFRVMEKIGYWKDKPLLSSSLLLADTPGTIGGEGASFFVGSNRAEGAICCLRSMVLLDKPAGNELQQAIDQVLREAGLLPEQIDLIVAGLNGDSRSNPDYRSVFRSFPGIAIAGFKHLCGEYDTASGFALWLVASLFRWQNVPESLLYRGTAPAVLRRILLVNHSLHGNWTVMVLVHPQA